MPRRNKNGGKNQKRTPSHQRSNHKKSSKKKSSKKKKSSVKVGAPKKSSRSRPNKKKKTSQRGLKNPSKKNSQLKDPHKLIGTNLCGKVQLHEDGFAFVLADDITLPNIYLAKNETSELLNNDYVEIVVDDVFGDAKYSGKLIQIVRRHKKELFGVLRKHAGGALVIPEEPRERRLSFNIEGQVPSELKSGALVLVEILEYPSKVPGKARIIKSMNDPSAPHHDTIKILVDGAWPREFSQESLDIAQKESDSWQEKWNTKNTQDLRDKNFVTIDGRDARDFDDAVYAEKTNKGHRLWVAIADVSSFVHLGTKLDEEALERSTSVYFPDHVVPMLPEVLSNNSCSLVPNKDRASLVCQMDIGKQGKISSYKFFGALIKSHKRMTYEEMQALMENKNWATEEIEASLENSLRSLIETFYLLNKAKTHRGALDLDIPEAQISLDEEGNVRNIQARSRLDSHRLIEECMLAANECASNYLFHPEQEAMFRIHEEPDRRKREELMKFAQLMSLDIKDFPETPSDFSKMIKLVKEDSNTDFAKEKSFQFMILRTMQQARYSEFRKGHFALALKDYTHFTSPIRRYPDLIVHRLIKKKLGILKGKSKAMKLPSLAVHCSNQERRSIDMERKLYDLKKCRFMEKHIGEEFTAFVTTVLERGVFCQIEEFFIDGLVSSENLNKRARARFDESTLCFRGPSNIKIEIGSRLRIQVVRVDLGSRKIDFELISIED